jgi:phage baseplate assembly protein W
MATIVSKKYPIDISKRTAIGFNFPLNGDAVFNQTFETRDQIRANLVNFLLTNQGERVFKPNFGADLRLLLFNFQDDVENDLVNIVRDRVKELFPSVSIERLTINRLDDTNTIQLNITYSIQSFGISDSISINLI